MNVVGKVGSLISQGVYSVATPFHPFGGAVDAIVVQQQDGTFRSTPWYVRFGKFQGVLKGAEKMVRINVNGVDADFHMYLDNSGEAYFIKEVDPAKGETSGVVKDSVNLEAAQEDSTLDSGSHNNVHPKILDIRRLEHSVSDSEVVLREEHVSLSTNRMERAESDADRRFYEFQDEQSSLEDSEYGSSRYDNFDTEHIMESQNLNSEVILVSVDGHVLTAPISESEKTTDNVQDTPRFNLGPGEETDFCEGNDEFSSGETAWAADYFSKLNASTISDASANVCSVKNDANGIGHQLVDEGGEGEQACQAQETQNTREEADLQMHVESEEVSATKAEKEHACQAQETQKKREETNLQMHIESEEASATKAEEEHACQAQETQKRREETDLQMHIESEEASAAKTEEEHACQAQETQKKREETDLQMHIKSEEASATKAEVFNSCPEVEEKAKDVVKSDVQYMSSSLEAQSSPEKSHQTFPVIDRTENAGVIESRNNDEFSASCGSVSPGNDMSPHSQDENESTEKIAISSEQKGIDSVSEHSVSKDPSWKDEQCVTSDAVDGTENSQQSLATGDECSKSDLIKPPTESSSEETKVHSSIRFEISLCGNELRAGMGVNAAAKAFDAHRISSEDFKISATSILKNENLIIRYRERYFSWEKVAPVILGMAAFDLEVHVEPEDAIHVEQDGLEKPRDEELPSTPTGRRWRLWPIPFRRVKTLEHTSSSNSSNEEEFVDSESGLLNSNVEATPKSPQKQLVRTNIPTNEQIASLNLKEGQNIITFSFSTRVWGTQQVDAHIYLWKWNARIVISDVDGTITKSDVLGQFMPLVGKDWTQSGVARLFSAIKENGYQLLFLSARAIVQAYLTRSFLLNLKQDGKALPNGPVVISPDGLFPSLYREVVRRAPHEFKIACLEDIKKLFPADNNPFYAGFGNRDTDELSYRKIGIPKGKIFIINPKGEVAISHHRADVKTYTSLHTLVNDMFPPTSLVEQVQEDFNSWNYWKMPLPDIA